MLIVYLLLYHSKQAIQNLRQFQNRNTTDKVSTYFTWAYKGRVFHHVRLSRSRENGIYILTQIHADGSELAVDYQECITTNNDSDVMYCFTNSFPKKAAREYKLYKLTDFGKYSIGSFPPNVSNLYFPVA